MRAGGVAGAMASTGSFQPIMSSYTAPLSEVKHPGGPKVTPDSDDIQPSKLDSHSTTLARLPADNLRWKRQLPQELVLLLQLLRYT